MKPRKITKNLISVFKNKKYQKISVENKRLKKSISTPDKVLLPKSVAVAIIENLPNPNIFEIEKMLPENVTKIIKASEFSIQFVKLIDYNLARNFKIGVNVFYNDECISSVEIFAIKKTYSFQKNIQITSYYWDFSSLNFEIITDEYWLIMYSSIKAFNSTLKTSI